MLATINYSLVACEPDAIDIKAVNKKIVVVVHNCCKFTLSFFKIVMIIPHSLQLIFV